MFCLLFKIIVLHIRFEKRSYTYIEPQGFDSHVVDDIFMVKNINTELTYTILFQITAEDAIRNRDYMSSVDTFGVVLNFDSNQERLQVFGDNSLFFEINPDSLPEGEETVEISSFPVQNPGPPYTRPQTGAVTTIFILDDDSM